MIVQESKEFQSQNTESSDEIDKLEDDFSQASTSSSALVLEEPRENIQYSISSDPGLWLRSLGDAERIFLV